jgi:hypothetical protein
MRCTACRLFLLGLLLACSAPSEAGFRVPEGLGAILRDAKAIAIFETESVNAEKRVITFKKVEDIRLGLSQRFRLYVPREDETEHRAAPGQEASEWLLRWAKPGQRIVSFNHQLVYVGGYWLQTWSIKEGETPYYKLIEWHALFGYSFAGSIHELARACRDILDGKEVIVPVFAPTPFVRDTVTLTHWRGQYEELPLARIKASLKITRIPRDHLRDRLNRDAPEWRLLVGPGSGRIEQLPRLLKQLRDCRSTERARAARQIGGIGSAAKKAIPQLTRLLEDERAMSRTAAAGAVLQLDPKHAAARRVLRQAAKDDCPAVRRSAVEWLWLLDRDVEGTVADLVGLQRDTDADVRATATRALKSFLMAYDLKGLSKDDLRAASKSPDKECARLANAELTR